MGKIEEPPFSSVETVRKSRNLTGACELFKIFEVEINDEFDLNEAFDAFRFLIKLLLIKCEEIDKEDSKNRTSVYKQQQYILQEVHERQPNVNGDDENWSDESEDERLNYKDRSYVTSSMRLTEHGVQIYDHCEKSEFPRPQDVDYKGYDYESFVYSPKSTREKVHLIPEEEPPLLKESAWYDSDRRIRLKNTGKDYKRFNALKSQKSMKDS